MTTHPSEVEGSIVLMKKKRLSPSPALKDANERLKFAINRLEIEISKLNENQRLLSRYFDQYSNYLEYLNEAENEMQLLEKVRNNLEDVEFFTDDLSSDVMNLAWEAGSTFNSFSSQLTYAVDELNVNLATLSNDVGSMAEVIEQYVLRTNNIKFISPRQGKGI